MLPVHAQSSVVAFTGNVRVTLLNYLQDHDTMAAIPVVEDEYVEVTNCDIISIDISGWIIRCVVGGGTSGLGSFTFPAGTVLVPGQTVRVWTHSPDPTDPNYMPGIVNFTYGVTNTFPGAFSWNNTGDTAELLDAVGMQVDLTPTYASSTLSPINYGCS